MYDIRWINENAKAFDKALSRRNLNDEERKNYSSQNLISIYDHRRALIRVLESWQAKRNAASKAIGQAKAKKDESKIQELMAEVAICKASISKLESEEKEAGERLNKLLEQIPNLPLDDVPDGKDASDNVEHRRFGRCAIMRLRRSSISISAKRSARWISRPRQSFPARALSF